MISSPVQTTIHRSIRNRIILCAIGIIALAGLAALNHRYLYNFISGPFQPSHTELVNAPDSDALYRYFVTIRGDDIIQTGYEYEETQNGRVVNVEHYLALVLDRRVLLVKTHDTGTTTEFTGALVPFSSEERREVVDKLIQEEPLLKEAFLPMLLDTSDFRTNGYIWLGAGTVVLLLCLWQIFQSARWATDPLKHPIMRGLERFGPAQFVASDLDAQLLTDHLTLGKAHLTANWLAIISSSTLQATRLDDIVWLYKQVTQQRVNGIPTRKSYSALIWDRHGVCISVSDKEKAVEELLSAILQRSPGALAGYDAQLETAWKKNRASFITAVDERRRQAASSQVEQEALS